MSFESVIDRFGTFVRGLYSPKAGPEVPFPVQLESFRAVIEHHLPPLVAVGRADRELLSAERDVIVDHCRALLRYRDTLLSASEISTLEDFIERFAPSPSQLETALRKFQTEGQDQFANLLAAADRVILADDVIKQEERDELAAIKKQYDQLRAKS